MREKQTAKSVDKKDIISASKLFKYAWDQIEQEIAKNMLETGVKRDLSSYQKAKIIQKFINMKNKPLQNRFFYSQFYEQHDKGEKI